ncbi:hypothetical protein D3C71_1851350 [compost metagenome]
MLRESNANADSQLDAVSVVQMDNMLAHRGAKALRFLQRCILAAGKEAYGEFLTANSAGNPIVLVDIKYFTGEIDQCLVTRHVPVCIVN